MSTHGFIRIPKLNLEITSCPKMGGRRREGGTKGEGRNEGGNEERDGRRGTKEEKKEGS